MSVFNRDSIVHLYVQPYTDEMHATAQERRRDRIRERYERRYGVPLPTYADVQRAWERYRAARPIRIGVYADEYGIPIDWSKTEPTR